MRHAMLGCIVIAAFAVGSNCQSPTATCREGTGPPPLILRWLELPLEGSVAVLPGGLATLEVTNDTAEALTVLLRLAGALDDFRGQVDLGSVLVPAQSAVAVPVDLTTFPPALQSLLFSARLVAHGRVEQTVTQSVEHLVYSPHVYVHDDGSGVTAYRVEAMLGTFDAGDPYDNALALRSYAEQQGLTVLGVGPLGRSLPLSDDDGGPP